MPVINQEINWKPTKETTTEMGRATQEKRGVITLGGVGNQV